MTKSDYIAKTKAMKRHFIKIGFLWAAGFCGFMLWHDFRFGRNNPSDTDALWSICFVVYFCSCVVSTIWLQIRHKKRHGLICPHCGNPFTSIAVETGKYRRCEEVILDDTHTT
jgi:hypothetical protein